MRHVHVYGREAAILVVVATLACGGGSRSTAQDATPSTPSAQLMPSTHSIAGSVTGASYPVTVTVAGPAAQISIQTDAGGAFAFTGLADGFQYTVTPSAPLLQFSPASRTVTISGQDVSGVGFAASAR